MVICPECGTAHMPKRRALASSAVDVAAAANDDNGEPIRHEQ